ncbi:MAG: hypothetical protein E6J31_11160 [Chloroflexi bacterium]|nr:MAG: hypothetical protein E6J36_02150 [Chloroflexota bacterium]TMC38190.1 MAG: hypothetical protein E6J31_11160 [Chloroflexota bacterium]TMC99675.1 MAG: hypothetical protein E6J11_07040 [Chloroflexota bacterium]TMD81334.1 MAG: hypothetical protein E6I97_00605 [Chloroflexota bacterium]
MELSLRLDTLEMVEIRYLRHRDRYRDWPSFQLLAASRQAKIMAYMTKDVAEQLHQQILIVESAVGLDEDEDGDELDEDSIDDEPKGSSEGAKSTERDSSTFSPAFAQALERLNDLARQRLPEGNIGSTGSKQPIQSGDVTAESNEVSGDDDDALEQLQDAFVQMMEVVRELAEELSTDALKISGRFRCARTNIEFIQAVSEADEEDDEEMAEESESGVMEVEVELVMVLQLFEEGRARPDDLPVVELQLDVDDFERLHETLDFALQQEERSRRRK